MEDNREEEENAFALADKAEAEAWELSQKAKNWECGAEEGQLREKDENEEEEEEKMMEDDYHSYPLFRIGDKIFADPTCQGALFLKSANDKHGEGGGVEQDKLPLLCLPLHTEQQLPLQSKHGAHSNFSQDTCPRGEPHLHQQAELELPLLQPGVDQEAQQQEAEERKTAAAMQYMAELELPFPAAQKKLKQKEEEEQEKKLEEDELLPLLLPKEEEAIAEFDCRECWLYLHSAQEHHAMQQ